MLDRFARLMYRRRRRVVATWVLAVVALSAAADVEGEARPVEADEELEPVAA